MGTKFFGKQNIPINVKYRVTELHFAILDIKNSSKLVHIKQTSRDNFHEQYAKDIHQYLDMALCVIFNNDFHMIFIFYFYFSYFERYSLEKTVLWFYSIQYKKLLK